MEIQRPGISRVLQWIIAIGLFAAAGVAWPFNQLGQNMINVTAGCILAAGIDRTLSFYRCYEGDNGFDIEATFMILAFFLIGIILERFHSSSSKQIVINRLCFGIVAVILALNGLCYLITLVVIIGYLCRQLYRLMSETLLPQSSIITSSQLQILRSTKRPYQEIVKQNELTSDICPICFVEYDDESMCIMLPGCSHCFHDECILEWLSTKETCPYCRHNIRVQII